MSWQHYHHHHEVDDIGRQMAHIIVAANEEELHEKHHLHLAPNHRQHSTAATDFKFMILQGSPNQQWVLSSRSRPSHHGRRLRPLLLMICVVAVIVLFILSRHWWKLTGFLSPALNHGAGSVLSSTRSPTPVLQVFEVHEPVLIPFSNDNGARNYTPPSCPFNRVVINLTVTSRGRQFDRLAMMYFNDTEVWRTSTAEPTFDGIVWSYHKDMSEYMYLWNKPQKVIFDLGNLVDDTYTGLFNTTLTATFFTISDEEDMSPPPASVILPISARYAASNQGSVFRLPSETAANTLLLPRNAQRAVVTISACGQAAEEFWWSNVLSSDVDTFFPTGGALYGFSPFREVQLYIDGILAGVVWPFPVIFTGGVVPSLWRPIVGIQVFDLKEHEIDISPFLPLLSNGQPHTFEIKVAGLDDDGKRTANLTDIVGNSWFVTGKIFLWLNEDEDYITKGTMPTFHLPQPRISISQSLEQNETGANETLNYTVRVARSLTISSSLLSHANTAPIPVSWEQNLMYSTTSTFTAQGAVQVVSFLSGGIDIASTIVSPKTKDTKDRIEEPTTFKATYSSPLWANTTTIMDRESGNFSIIASLNRSISSTVEGPSVFPSGLDSLYIVSSSTNDNNTNITLPGPSSFSGTFTSSSLNGTGFYHASPKLNTSIGGGTTSQSYLWGGINKVGNSALGIYDRIVEARQGHVVRDTEVFGGSVWRDYEEDDIDSDMAREEGKEIFAKREARDILGRC